MPPPYQYRCNRCETTSPEVFTRARLDEERDTHRDRFHGGHIPDGEEFLEAARMRLVDVPREQWIVGLILLAVFVVMGFYRHM